MGSVLSSTTKPYGGEEWKSILKPVLWASSLGIYEKAKALSHTSFPLLVPRSPICSVWHTRPLSSLLLLSTPHCSMLVILNLYVLLELITNSFLILISKSNNNNTRKQSVLLVFLRFFFLKVQHCFRVSVHSDSCILRVSNNVDCGVRNYRLKFFLHYLSAHFWVLWKLWAT